MGEKGRLIGVREGRPDLGPPPEVPEGLRMRVGAAEQSNTSIVFGDRWILKLFRRLEEGANLDRELGAHLTRVGFPHTPDVVGALEYRADKSGRATAAVLQTFVPNQGDAWQFTLHALQRYFERALASARDPWTAPLPGGDLVAAARVEPPKEVHEAIEDVYLEAARLLGRRTGELHQALASGEGPEFQPEPFSQLYQRALYQSMRNRLEQTFRSVQQGIGRLAGEDRARAEKILASRAELLACFRPIAAQRLEGARIRIHGDYHLGQVLYTGKDFVIIDFEGEPERPLSERRLKRSPLRDIAGMLRSAHYAAVSALFRESERVAGGAAELKALEGWALFWHRWVSAVFLKGYLETMEGWTFLPAGDHERALLLDVYLLDKALYELGYELANRPTWARIPMEGILELLGRAGARG